MSHPVQIFEVLSRFSSLTIPRAVHTQDDYGDRALHYAARWGHTELATILLDAGADIGAKNKKGSMALERAAAYAHQDTLQLLLCRGANVNESTELSLVVPSRLLPQKDMGR